MTNSVATSDLEISRLAAAWHEAELELQVLRRSEPAEAYEKAEAARTAYLRALSPVPSRDVSVHAFWFRLAILGTVVVLICGRVFLHR